MTWSRRGRGYDVGRSRRERRQLIDSVRRVLDSSEASEAVQDRIIAGLERVDNLDRLRELVEAFHVDLKAFLQIKGAEVSLALCSVVSIADLEASDRLLELENLESELDLSFALAALE
jgi:hypothetical protein